MSTASPLASAASSSKRQPVHTPTVIYIDGFNFYYGVVKGTKHKWLNLERFCRYLRPHDDIVRIRYFSAQVEGVNKVANQAAYIRALETLPTIDVILGRFKKKQVKCLLQPPCAFTGLKLFHMFEEKRTDVNIAVHMLQDAHDGVCKRMVLISGDSDLVPALAMVKARYPGIKLHVYVPTRNAIRGAATELRTAADEHRTLPLNLLPKAQFPASVSDGAGGQIQKPKTW